MQEVKTPTAQRKKRRKKGSHAAQQSFEHKTQGSILVNENLQMKKNENAAELVRIVTQKIMRSRS